MERRGNLILSAVRRCFVIAAAVILMLAALQAAMVLRDADCAYAADPEVDYTDNGIPVLSITLDRDEFDKVNRSEDHSYKATDATVKIDVPDGFRSDYTEAALPETTGDLKLEYMRGRGNSTWQEEKKPYKIKLDKKAELLGMGKNKNWVLLTNYSDYSLLRNRLVLYMGRALGLKYTPKCEPVDLVVKNKEGTFSRYLGSYLLCEDVRIDKSRVDIDELTPADTDAQAVTGGYLLAMEPYDFGYKHEPLQNIFWTDRQVKFKTDNPEFWSDDPADEGKLGVTQQKEYITDFMQKVEDAIFADDFKAEDGTPYSDLLDTEAAAKYWWVQEFVENGDAFKTPSTYLYKERDKEQTDGTVTPGKLYFGPLWDFDLAMGIEAEDEEEFDSGMSFSRSNMLWLDRLRGYNSEYRDVLMSTWTEYDAVLTDIIKEGGVLDTMLAQTKKSWEDEMNTNFRMDMEGTAESEAEKVRAFIRAKQNWVRKNIDEKLGDARIKVTYKAGSEIVKEFDWMSGACIGPAPEAPEKKGMTFTCWKDQKGEPYLPTDMPMEDKVYTATYVSDSKVKRPAQLYVGSDIVWGEIHQKVFYPEFCVMPENAQDKNIKWKSSDPGIAEVATDGSVTMKKTGKAVITGTIRTAKGNLSKSYTINVFDCFEYGFSRLPVPEKMTSEVKVIRMKPGSYAQVRIDKGDKPCDNYPEYYTDPEDVVYVTDAGVIIAENPGTTTVKAQIQDKVSCTFKVIVSKYANPIKAKGRVIRVKASKFKKKSKTYTRKKAIKITKQKAKVTYKLLKVTKKKYKKYFKVNSKTGKLKVKKGLKKGTYKLRILVTSGNSRYATKKIIVNVKVKVR